jgi:hypothetical protein
MANTAVSAIGDTQNLSSPKRVEALRDVGMSSVAVGVLHALALAEDGLMYAWGENLHDALLGNPHVDMDLLPKPVEALRGVRVGGVVAGGRHNYAVADTGEVWAWGRDIMDYTPLGHGEQIDCPLPKPIASLRGIKVDAVAPALFTRLRWQTTEVCTRGQAPWAQHCWVGSACTFQRAIGEKACLHRGASRRCVWRVGCDGVHSSLERGCVGVCVCVCRWVEVVDG